MSIYNILEGNNTLTISSETEFSSGIKLGKSDPDIDSTTPTLAIYQNDNGETVDIEDEAGDVIGSCTTSFTRIGNIIFVRLTDVLVETGDDVTAYFTLAQDSIPDGYRVNTSMCCGCMFWRGDDTHISSIEIKSGTDSIRFTAYDSDFPSGETFEPGDGDDSQLTFSYIISN